MNDFQICGSSIFNPSLDNSSTKNRAATSTCENEVTESSRKETKKKKKVEKSRRSLLQQDGLRSSNKVVSKRTSKSLNDFKSSRSNFKLSNKGDVCLKIDIGKHRSWIEIDPLQVDVVSPPTRWQQMCGTQSSIIRRTNGAKDSVLETPSSDTTVLPEWKNSSIELLERTNFDNISDGALTDDIASPLLLPNSTWLLEPTNSFREQELDHFDVTVSSPLLDASVILSDTDTSFTRRLDEVLCSSYHPESCFTKDAIDLQQWCDSVQVEADLKASSRKWKGDSVSIIPILNDLTPAPSPLDANQPILSKGTSNEENVYFVSQTCEENQNIPLNDDETLTNTDETFNKDISVQHSSLFKECHEDHQLPFVTPCFENDLENTSKKKTDLSANNPAQPQTSPHTNELFQLCSAKIVRILLRRSFSRMLEHTMYKMRQNERIIEITQMLLSKWRQFTKVNKEKERRVAKELCVKKLRTGFMCWSKLSSERSAVLKNASMHIRLKMEAKVFHAWRYRRLTLAMNWYNIHLITFFFHSWARFPRSELKQEEPFEQISRLGKSNRSLLSFVEPSQTMPTMALPDAKCPLSRNQVDTLPVSSASDRVPSHRSSESPSVSLKVAGRRSPNLLDELEHRATQRSQKMKALQAKYAEKKIQQEKSRRNEVTEKENLQHFRDAATREKQRSEEQMKRNLSKEKWKLACLHSQVSLLKRMLKSWATGVLHNLEIKQKKSYLFHREKLLSRYLNLWIQIVKDLIRQRIEADAKMMIDAGKLFSKFFRPETPAMIA